MPQNIPADYAWIHTHVSTQARFTTAAASGKGGVGSVRSHYKTSKRDEILKTLTYSHQWARGRVTFWCFKCYDLQNDAVDAGGHDTRDGHGHRCGTSRSLRPKGFCPSVWGSPRGTGWPSAVWRGVGGQGCRGHRRPIPGAHAVRHPAPSSRAAQSGEGPPGPHLVLLRRQSYINLPRAGPLPKKEQKMLPKGDLQST